MYALPGDMEHRNRCNNFSQTGKTDKLQVTHTPLHFSVSVVYGYGLQEWRQLLQSDRKKIIRKKKSSVGSLYLLLSSIILQNDDVKKFSI